MKEKILAALVAINGQYNLPKDVLERFAGMADIESEDKISSWVDSQKPMLALLQSYSDSRVTTKVKEVEELKKEVESLKSAASKVPTSVEDADLEKRLGALFDERMKGFSTQIETLTKANEGLQKKLKESELADKEKKFVELKKRVASELGLNDSVLSLLEGKLNSDMDEKKINEVLSESKKTLVELGLSPVEGIKVNANAEQVAQQRAKAYLEKFKPDQK